MEHNTRINLIFFGKPLIKYELVTLFAENFYYWVRIINIGQTRCKRFSRYLCTFVSLFVGRLYTW